MSFPNTQGFPSSARWPGMPLDTPEITALPNLSRISRVAGKDSTSLGFTTDFEYQAYQVRAVASEASTVETGTLIESGTGGVAGVEVPIVITDDELVNAGVGDGTHLLKVFTQLIDGRWSA